MQEILLKIRYFERGLSKSLKLILFFLLNPVPFNGQSYQKQKGLGTSDQSLFRLKNKFRKIPLLVIHYLKKITSANLCRPIHDIINYSTSICPFESEKCGKEGKKYKNLNISRTKRAF